ncbi:MAG: 50S ribosomal protein L32 [Planctomycetes bacterium]|jgi:large subunit ribosomal protein L32|nr:50S ribosomal protein L32 [Planctomycetota bacterium]
MLPTKKKSKSTQRSRQAHKALKPVNYSLCKKCGAAKLPHAACAECGYVNKDMTLKLGKEAEE